MTTQITVAEDTAPIKILFVEDDKYLREPVEKMLKNHYDVRSATNVEEGRSIWRSFQPDIVILDMTIPLDVGTEPFRRGGLTLLKQAPKDKAKVILASNLPEENVVMRKALSITDHNFGKVFLTDIDQLDLIIKKLLTNGEPPVRIVKHNHTLIQIKNTKKKKKNNPTFIQKCLSVFK